MLEALLDFVLLAVCGFLIALAFDMTPVGAGHDEDHYTLSDGTECVAVYDGSRSRQLGFKCD